jgi:hypothetical protein
MKRGKEKVENLKQNETGEKRKKGEEKEKMGSKRVK